MNKKPSSARTVSRKAQKKRPVTPEERLRRLFTSLCAQVDGGHFTNAIKTCNKILLSDFPADKDALQTKLFLLLQTEQYDDALSLIRDADRHSDFAFEKAYALYRLQREAEAASVLAEMKKTQGDHHGVSHLEAQLNYRQGSYQTSLDLYNELMETADPQSEEYSDVLTNLTASQKHLDFINTGFLRALDALSSLIISTIEIAPPPTSHPTQVLVELHAAQNKPSEDPPAGRTKKVRMKRVPKGVIPGVTPAPDPERWLKKSERTNYGQGSRKRKGVGGGATQGVVADIAPSQTIPTKAGAASHSKGKKRK